MIPGLAWIRRRLTIDAFPWYLRDGTTKIGMLSPECPCGFEWHIATLCACDNCQNFGEKQQVGDFPIFCDDGTTPCEWPDGAGMDGDEPQMWAVTMNTALASSTGKAIWGEPIWCVSGAYLTSVRISLTPPFTGQATAHLFVDGTEKSLVGAQFDVVRGEPIFAGYNQLDTATGSCWVRILQIETAVQLSSVEAHEIILRVDYVASGDETEDDGTTQKHYAVRHALVWEFPEPPIIGGTYLIPFDPERINSTQCSIRTDDGIWCFWSKISTGIDVNGKHYLGPFSGDQATYVAGRWAELISALADGCTCTNDCGSGATFANFTGPTGSEWEDLGATAGAFTAHVGSPSSTCYWFLDFGYTPQDGISFRWEVTDSDGNVSYADLSTGTFIIPPCTTWQLQAKFDGDIFEWRQDLVGGDCYPLHSDVPCAFDEGGTLEGVQTLYDSVSHFGIPANSAELAEFLEWETGAISDCSDAGGTWNSSTLTCELPE